MASAELPSSLASSPPSPPRLPVALLAQIVDEAAADRDELDHTTLRHLCLSSKSILPFARSALYRDITVTFNDNEDFDSAGAEIPVNPLEAERLCFATNGEALEATLARAPHLAQMVRRIAFDWVADRQGSIHLSRHAVESLLLICPNIAAFALVDPYYEESEAVVLGLLQGEANLVELDVGYMPHVPLLLARLPHLRRLHLLMYDEWEGDEVSSFPFKLESLQVSKWNPIPTELFDELVRCSSDSLRRLDLVPTAADQVIPHLRRFSSLSHLRFEPNTAHDPVSLSSELIEVLPKCGGLRSLELGGSTFPSSRMARLPHQLQIIHFEDGAEVEGVAMIFSDDSRQALRQVVVEKGGNEDWEALGAEHGWQVEHFGEKVVLAR